LSNDFDFDAIFNSPEPEVAAVNPTGEGPEDELGYLRDYHLTRGRHLAVGISAMKDWEREAISDFLDILSVNMRDGFSFVGSEELGRIADMIRRGADSNAVIAGEPWLSSVKFTRQEVTPLNLMVLKSLFSFVTMSDLVSAGFEDGDEDEIVGKLSKMDWWTMETLSRALAKLAEARDANVVRLTQARRNVDFAMACCGDREAMSRMSIHVAESLGALFMPGNTVTTEMSRRVTLAKAWQGLSLAYWNEPGNPRPLNVATAVLSATRVFLLGPDLSGSMWPSSEYIVIPKVRDDDLPIAQVFRNLGIHWWRTVTNRPSSSDLEEIGNRKLANIARWIDTDVTGRPAPRFRGDPENDIFRHYSGELPGASESEPHPARPTMSVYVPAPGTRWEQGDASTPLRSPMPIVIPEIGPDELHAALEAEFPWMAQLNLIAARAVATTSRQADAFRLRPLLIIGPHGTGKSRWVRRVSELMGLSLYVASMAGEDTARHVSGVPRGWASEVPSLPAKGFVHTGQANFVMQVDDIDQVQERSENVAAAFIPMLAKAGNPAFPEPYHRGTLNVTGVSFIFTAVASRKISSGFLSAIRSVNVGRPTWEQVERILPTMFSESCESARVPAYVRPDYDAFASRSRKIWMDQGGLGNIARLIEDMAEEVSWSPKRPGLTIVSD
jgi:hypothetical protein